MNGMMEAAFINVKNRSKTITAEIEVPENGGNGIILAQGGRFEFAYKGGGPGKGGTGTLFVNDEKVGEGTIPHTQAGMFSADETADVGIDLGTPVLEVIGAEEKSKFNGRIPKLTIETR
jgi:arylsulfatase